MKYTLLEIVQNILSSMDSDEVTSINETTESRQVAEVVRTAYFDLRNRAELPEQRIVTHLQTVSNVPVLFVPEGYEGLQWVKYDSATLEQSSAGQTNYQTLQFLPIKEFMDRSDRLGNSLGDDVTVEEVSFSNVLDDDPNLTYYVTNNVAPRYYTISRDRYVICDSYDSTVDTTGLLGEKSKAYMRIIEDFELDDVFQPDLDEPQYQLWLNEAKALAWAELKQSPHQKAEQAASRGWSQLQKTKHRIKGLSDFEMLPSFGRKGCTHYG